MGSIPLLTRPPIPGIQQLKKDLTASVDYLVAMTAIMIWDVVSLFFPLLFGLTRLSSPLSLQRETTD